LVVPVESDQEDTVSQRSKCDKREYTGGGAGLIVDLGAGESPHRDADVTVDIREDIDVDYGGIDIGRDSLPFGDASVGIVICRHVFEHVPPQRLGHALTEIDRVLEPGGKLIVEAPHAATASARADPTHQAAWTLVTADYFAGRTYDYYGLDWAIEATAHLEAPTLIRPSWRLKWTMTHPALTSGVASLPFVDGFVRFIATKMISDCNE
jgi:SAM-dependent methyltransferase